MVDTILAAAVTVGLALVAWLHALTLAEEERSRATRALWWYYNRPWMLFSTPRQRVAIGLCGAALAEQSLDVWCLRRAPFVDVPSRSCEFSRAGAPEDASKDGSAAIS